MFPRSCVVCKLRYWPSPLFCEMCPTCHRHFAFLLPIMPVINMVELEGFAEWTAE